MSEEAKTESIFLEVNLGAWAGTKCPEKKLYIKNSEDSIDGQPPYVDNENLSFKVCL